MNDFERGFTEELEKISKLVRKIPGKKKLIEKIWKPISKPKPQAPPGLPVQALIQKPPAAPKESLSQQLKRVGERVKARPPKPAGYTAAKAPRPAPTKRVPPAPPKKTAPPKTTAAQREAKRMKELQARRAALLIGGAGAGALGGTALVGGAGLGSLAAVMAADRKRRQATQAQA